MALFDHYMQCDFGSLLNVYSGRARLGGAMLALVPPMSPQRALGEAAPGPASDRGPAEVRRVRFVFQPLTVPHTARVRAEGATHLFVRFSSPVKGAATLAIPPMLEKEVELELKAARREGHPVDRVVVVGSDALFAGPGAAGGDPRSAEGYDAAVDAFASLLSSLVKERVPFVWRTRGGLAGNMPAALSRALLDAGALATLELGLPSLDAGLCAALEGAGGASPEERLRLASAASARGVSVRGLLDPLVPMLTDQRAALEPLLQALADAGVHRVGVRYLVMTRDKAKSLARRLSSMHRALIQGCFADQPWLAPKPEGGAAFEQKAHKLLPRALREKGHSRVIDLAARVGIVIDVLDPPGADEDIVLTEPQREEGPKAPRRRAKKKPQLELFRVRR